MPLITISKYAKDCNVNIRTIYARIKNKQLKPVIKKLPDGSKKRYIDTKKSPALRFRLKGAGRKLAIKKLVPEINKQLKNK